MGRNSKKLYGNSDLDSRVQSVLQKSSKLIKQTSRFIQNNPLKNPKKKHSYRNVYITITLVLVLTAIALLLYFLIVSE